MDKLAINYVNKISMGEYFQPIWGKMFHVEGIVTLGW